MKKIPRIFNLLFYILLLFPLWGLGGCSTNDDNSGFTPTLPPETQTGENTFGCYIDGILLTPRNGTGTFNSNDVGMSYIGLGDEPDFIYNEIKVRDYKSGTGGLLTIHIVGLHENGEGVYFINQSNCQDGIDANPTVNVLCRIWDNNLQAYKWYCSIEDAGTLSITKYDLENRILSGTFDFTAANQDDPNDIIEITEGRFDIDWGELNDYTEFP